MNAPLLSVCLITYNHIKYIRYAIEGVLMQKTDFPWELIIADDFSKDGTREIVLEYQRRYPERVKLILQQHNVGGGQNWIDLITKPSSKYIAYFEGDDYWTDPLKLQRQVDFLEANAEYAGCQHRVMCVFEDGSSRPDQIQFCDQTELTLRDILDRNFFSANGYNVSRTHSSSLLFKGDVIAGGFPAQYNTMMQGDHFLYLLITLQGKIKILSEVMSTYRIHGQGQSSKVGLGDYPDKEKRREQFLRMYDLFQRVTPQEYYYEIEYIKKGLRLFFELEDAKKRCREQGEDMAFKHAVWVWERVAEKQFSEIALWGAGSHTRELLSRLKEKELCLPRIIFDQNPIPGTMCGIPVRKPQANDRVLFDGIVLSSMVFQDPMRSDVCRIFGEDTPCLDLYEGFLGQKTLSQCNEIAAE